MWINFLIYTIFTLFTANACSIFESGDWFQIVVLAFLTIVFIHRKCRIDNGIIVVLGLWCIINAVSYYLNGRGGFPILPFLSVTSRILFPYMMVKIVGTNFFRGLFNYWFVLCVLGFPLFLVESLFPQFVSSLAPILNFMTQEEQTVKGGFYLFFYMHSAWAEFIGPIVRNSGFMWEPGGYSCVLIFMIVYRLYNNGFQVDKKLVFLIICLLTTFSTSGYFALFFIILFYLYKNKYLYYRYRAILPVVFFAILVAGIAFYLSADFMSGKVDRYIEQGTDSYEWRFQNERMTRVSRLGIAIIALENSLYNPWGDGIIRSKYIIEEYHNAVGPNSLAEILMRWGWLGIVALFYSLYNFKIDGRKCGLMLLIPLAFPLFSNPFAFRTLIYAIVFSVICISEVIQNKEDEEDTTDEPISSLS